MSKMVMIRSTRAADNDTIGIDDVRIHRVSAMGGIDLVSARFLTRRSSPHSHRELEIGVVTSGTRAVNWRGRFFTATRGSVLVFGAGEVHAGSPTGAGGSEYVAFLIPQDRLAGLAWFVPDEFLACDSPMINDPDMARRLADLHAAFVGSTSETTPALEAQLLSAIETLHRSHRRASGDAARVERAAIARVRNYLEQHYGARVRLDDLSTISGLSVFHLIRVFRAETGLSPYAYLGQVRVHKALALLRQGVPVSTVAAATGFADQSHLTRLFKRLVGVPPGEYQRAGLPRAGTSRHLRRRLVDFPSRLEPGTFNGR